MATIIYKHGCGRHGADHPRNRTHRGKKKNPNAVALGRLGGLKGGKARAKKLSPERRSEIARNAANIRWQKALEEVREKMKGKKHIYKCVNAKNVENYTK